MRKQLNLSLDYEQEARVLRLCPPHMSTSEFAKGLLMSEIYRREKLGKNPFKNQTKKRLTHETFI